MDTPQPRDISVLEPIGAAFEKTKQILFQPFDIGKWFTLGFCAWLATLGEGGGGGGGNYNFGGGSHGGPGPEFHQEFESFKHEVIQNLPVILTVGICIVVFIILLALVFAWLRSRGQFMFLHGVARNVAEVVNPWHRYARPANSLFLFRIVLGLLGAIVSLALVIPLIFLFIRFAETDFKVFAAAGIVPAIFLVMALIGFGLAMTVIGVLTKDFVVPVMYIHACTVLEGWRRFWDLCRFHKGTFLLFLLALFVLNIAVGMIIVMVIVFTCCCAACFFAIPYIGTVALLPLLVWRRAYSALFLAQFGAEYDVFAASAQVVVPTGLIPPAEPPTEQNF